ncbi:LPS export ABC transporter periplasmic protein LptC [Pseudoxanthomonas winnipegensis]|uniref:Lipopolysaccharide export system protein LptC n=1 Tax=Pseudoxanthomonas winnipegensis TaxID=2480810 RepID=A0A4V2HCX9_9GAMM|nr:LPS export ABC transporter periplasmic protein LptC [Pseudoxanthomonas winnipegensis]TAA24573.1 LPS export ABC transporter periplasmic protein LptC [Pseudoxanthomonas winnipegensis]
MNWRSGLALALLIALLLFGWSAWDNRKKPHGSGPAAQSDYIMHDFEMVTLNKDGTEGVTLRAPEMHRTASDETFSITTPLFLMPDKNGQHWELRSKTAWVAAKGEKAVLTGDVLGNSPPEAATRSTFATSRLDVFPDQHVASTDQPVTLTQPGSTLQGTGFEINTQTQQYKFKSKVKSRYVPKSAQ